MIRVARCVLRVTGCGLRVAGYVFRVTRYVVCVSESELPACLIATQPSKRATRNP